MSKLKVGDVLTQVTFLSDDMIITECVVVEIDDEYCRYKKVNDLAVGKVRMSMVTLGNSVDLINGSKFYRVSNHDVFVGNLRTRLNEYYIEKHDALKVIQLDQGKVIQKYIWNKRDKAKVEEK